MRLGERSRFVALAKKYVLYKHAYVGILMLSRFEQFFGRSAYAHLFVTNAMKEYLVQNWDLQ